MLFIKIEIIHVVSGLPVACLGVWKRVQRKWVSVVLLKYHRKTVKLRVSVFSAAIAKELSIWVWWPLSSTIVSSVSTFWRVRTVVDFIVVMSVPIVRVVVIVFAKFYSSTRREIVTLLRVLVAGSQLLESGRENFVRVRVLKPYFLYNYATQVVSSTFGRLLKELFLKLKGHSLNECFLNAASTLVCAIDSGWYSTWTSGDIWESPKR